MTTNLLRIKDVATRYGVSVSTVRRWMKSGKLSGQKVGGRWRFTLEDVQGLFTGIQPGASGLTEVHADFRQYVQNKPWARDALRTWQNGLTAVLESVSPDHVIVNDRRGAKVWSLIAPSNYRWGVNLWHSTISEHLPEDELRKLWSRPDTRRRLLDGLEEKGYGKEQLNELTRMVDAENSDLYDVLAHVAFALAPVSREERVNTHKSLIFAHYGDKQQEFLDFVLEQYVRQGVEELDDQKLPHLIELKYHAVADAVAELGQVAAIREIFIGFQKHLYEATSVA